MEQLFELQNMMPRVQNYSDLCEWMAESIDNMTVHWPLYHGCNRILGCDSTGGTDPKPYSDLCRKGLLTLSSQDGYDSPEELQYGYVKLCFPISYPFNLNLIDAVVYNESDWSELVNERWLKLYPSFRRSLTFKKIVLWEPTYPIYQEDTIKILKQELKTWEGLTGEAFGDINLDNIIVLYIIAKEPGPRNMAKYMLELVNRFQEVIH